MQTTAALPAVDVVRSWPRPWRAPAPVRKPLGWVLCTTFLMLQFAIVLHSAEHLWHDVEHESAICSVTAANPVGTLAEGVVVETPGWELIGARIGQSHRSACVAPLLAYQSRGPPQSIS